jgi:hypothetical protein
MGNQAAIDSSFPLLYSPILNPTARLQVSIANRAVMGSSVHSSRTTPAAWVLMDRILEDFLDHEHECS